MFIKITKNKYDKLAHTLRVNIIDAGFLYDSGYTNIKQFGVIVNMSDNTEYPIYRTTNIEDAIKFMDDFIKQINT